jgi:hypothetical protein
MVGIVITTSFYSNSILNYNVESVQFDQAVNAVLSLERMAKKIMFKPQSTGTIKTSFVTTDPNIVQEGNLIIQIGVYKLTSIPVYSFKILGGESVGVSFPQDYVGGDSLLLVGLDGSLSYVRKYQDQGAWVSLDYGRIRCIYCGEMNYYNGTNPIPTKRNVVEITAVRLSSGGISPLERSRIILENTGIQTQQIELEPGDFTIMVQFPSKGSKSVSLYFDLHGNTTLSTLVDFSIIDFKITVLGGG